MAKRWYVVHAYSGYEKKVAASLRERVALHEMQESFGEILVPTEEVVEMRGGQKRKSERKFFPGYVLVQMELNDDTWHLVKDTPRVMGFIGGKGDRSFERNLFYFLPPCRFLSHLLPTIAANLGNNALCHIHLLLHAMPNYS